MIVAVLIRLFLSISFSGGDTIGLTENCYLAQNQVYQEQAFALEMPANPLSDIPMTWGNFEPLSETAANCFSMFMIDPAKVSDVGWL